MYHHDIMRSIIRERVRDLRAEADAARDAGRVRRAREYWAERAERAVRPIRRRRPAGRCAEPACRTAPAGAGPVEW